MFEQKENFLSIQVSAWEEWVAPGSDSGIWAASKVWLCRFIVLQVQFPCSENGSNKYIPLHLLWWLNKIRHVEWLSRASQVVLVIENLPTNSGDIRDAGLILGSERCPGGGHGSPLQCSCLENPRDRGAWRARVHRVTKSQTRLKQLKTHTVVIG